LCRPANDAPRVEIDDYSQGQMIDSLIATSYTGSQGDVKSNSKLEQRYENAGEVIEKIVQAKGDPQAVRASIQSSGIQIFGSVENVLIAYDVIYRNLTNNYSDEAKLKNYWGHLANSVVFIQISTDLSSALKIFETINERGVGLDPMDLLFTQVPPERFSKLKDEWKNITRIDDTVNCPQDMISRNMILDREVAKQGALRFLPRSQHQNDPHLNKEIESVRSA
jgi:hypothetical protein